MNRPAPDPDAVRSCALSLQTVATVLAECARGYAALRSHQWSGEAADAAAARLALFSHDLTGASSALSEAAAALLSHASVLDEVVAHLAAARTRELAASSASAVEPEADQVVVTTLRSAAMSLLQASAAGTAATLTRVAGQAPRVASFGPRSLALEQVACDLDDLGWMAPGLPGVAALVRWVAVDPASTTRRTDEVVEKAVGTRADDVLDGGGLVPVIGDVADAAHIGLDLVRGRWTDAAVATIGLVPLAGDAVQGVTLPGRRAMRAATHGTQEVTESLARRRADAILAGSPKIAAEGRALGDDLGEHLVTRKIDALDTAFAANGDKGVYEKAVASFAQQPEAARERPSQTPYYGVLAGEGLHWSGHVEPSLLVADRRPTAWTGTVDVEQAGTVATYAFTLTRSGELRTGPTPLRSRPAGPDVDRSHRAPVVQTHRPPAPPPDDRRSITRITWGAR